MRRIFKLFAAVLITSVLLMSQLTSAQAPQKMSYQAVIRNSSNSLIISKVVGIRISILKGTSTGSSVYVETQKPTTNINGLASLEIGSGTVVSGNFATINWASGPYFIKMETDPTGGTNYSITGTSELMSVPYALFSGNGVTGTSNYWTLNGSDIYNNNIGNVGINTTTPADKFTVKTITNTFGLMHTDGTVTVGTYIGLGSGWLGTKSNHPLSFYTNNSLQQMTLLTNGNFGIGTTTPLAKLHVAGNVKVDGNNTIEFGAGVAGKEASAGKIGYKTFGAFDALDIVGAGTLGSNRKIRFWNEGGAEFMGNVGIGIATPANKLQIGSMGAAGYNGNDLAIGNGTNATGFFQSNSNLQVYSSTNIALMPSNGAGRVGINTATPRAPLDVENFNTVSIPGGYLFYGFLNGVGGTGTSGATSGTIGNISIIASNRILAFEFDAYSDARIKNIIGVSNKTKDLETINALQVIDYTLKDKIKYGNKPFKKVIAQEVEKVYPQVVSKHTDFIPNVYQLTSKAEKTANGYLLTFTDKHNISSTAKKLRVIITEGIQEMEIVSLPSDKQVIINGTDIKDEKVFVYGEEVADFRTVDYEGLTTLNISATQELSKLMKKQQEIIDKLQKQIDQMELRLSSLQASK